MSAPGSAPGRFDMDDPFGTRPDEKPPAGWDEAFWDGVRQRIEDKQSDPGSSEPPPPPPPQGRRLAVFTGLAIGAALIAAGVVMGQQPRYRPVPAEVSPVNTTVLVLGEEDPAVSVEWARRGRSRAGYVVLESLDPDVSYILIDGAGKTR